MDESAVGGTVWMKVPCGESVVGGTCMDESAAGWDCRGVRLPWVELPCFGDLGLHWGRGGGWGYARCG